MALPTDTPVGVRGTPGPAVPRVRPAVYGRSDPTAADEEKS